MSTVVAGLSLAAWHGGIASANPPSGSVIDVSVDAPTYPFDFFNGAIKCHLHGDREHPYLVLHPDNHGHNEHRIGRTVSYQTGDGKRLMPLEHIWAEDGAIVSELDYFNKAGLLTQIVGQDGHGSVTVRCADTPEAANQK
ncbi:hypothetical protein LQL77_31405 [Rhodococcus cerastii]|nr:hypothetical protein [Rhodococcus cerastii]